MSAVITYANDARRCFCQIKFDSGERVLISIAGMPKPSIKVMRLVLAGLVPMGNIWEHNLTIAGSLDNYVGQLLKMFPPDADASMHPLDIIRDLLLKCSSIEEARRTLLERQSQLLREQHARAD